MGILYVTRNQNHSGFSILNKLIEDKVPIIGIVLPQRLSLLDYSVSSFFVKIIYRIISSYQGNEKCKNLNSERLLAKRFNIPVYTIKTMNSKLFKKLLIETNPEIIFLGGGWPELIPSWVIEYLPDSIFNTHPSLLPDFRGTSITRWQILEGTELSGITIHKVDKSFDTGNILVSKEYKIPANENPQDLFKSLSEIAAEVVSELFKETSNLRDLSKISEKEQNNKKVTNNYYSKWSWDWNNQRIKLNTKYLKEIERFIRANNQESYFYFGPHLIINNMLFIVRKSKIIKSKNTFSTNKNFEYSISKLINCIITKNGIEIPSEDGSHILAITLIQKLDRVFKIRSAHHPKKFFKLGSYVKLRTSHKLRV